MGTDSQGHWPLYLMGARDVIAAAGLDTQIFQTEIGELVLWAFYHDVMARFSIFHWRRASVSRYFSRELGVEGGWQRDLCAFATRVFIHFFLSFCLSFYLSFFGAAQSIHPYICIHTSDGQVDGEVANDSLSYLSI